MTQTSMQGVSIGSEISFIGLCLEACSQTFPASNAFSSVSAKSLPFFSFSRSAKHAAGPGRSRLLGSNSAG